MMAGMPARPRHESEEAKYLGQLVLGGPTHARPGRHALRRMVEAIERAAPPKHKTRVRFHLDTVRAAGTPATHGHLRGTVEVLVGLVSDGDALLRVPLRDVVSVGSWHRCFCFITVNESCTPAEGTSAARFFVQAFRFRTADAAVRVCRDLVRNVEISRMKDMQHEQQYRHANSSLAWTPVRSGADRDRIMYEQGRHPMMSPLPETVPAAVHTVSDRPSVCSPLSPAQTEEFMRLKNQVQHAIDSPSMSPRPSGQRGAAQPNRTTRARPSPERAAQLQRQFGTALEGAAGLSPVTTPSPERRVTITPDVGARPVVTLHHTFTEVENPGMEAKRLVAPASSATVTPPLVSKLATGTPESGYGSDASSKPGSNVSLLSATDADCAGVGASASVVASALSFASLA